MIDLLVVSFYLALLICFWLALVASISLFRDPSLEPSQKFGQLLLVWFIPLLGAWIVLHLINEHSPESIPTKMIPWPVHRVILGRPLPVVSDKDFNEEMGIDLASSHSQDDSKL